MIAQPSAARRNAKRGFLKTGSPLAIAIVLAEQELARARSAGDLKQAAMLVKVACELRLRLESDFRKFEAARRYQRGGTAQKWGKFILEEIAGSPEYAEWLAGRIPVITYRYKRITQNVLRHFDEWLRNNKQEDSK